VEWSLTHVLEINDVRSKRKDKFMDFFTLTLLVIRTI
jgi:hypothetical protein